MALRVMYMLPMMLGRTFDVRNNFVGMDIFPQTQIDKPRVSEEPFYHSMFKTLETSSDVRDVLEISGDLSLNIKAGTFAFRGMGSYVMESLEAENSVDILTKVSFRTVSKNLPHSARPNPSWSSMDRTYLGTHFVQNVIYGGDLIACVRFRASRSENLRDIRGTVKASLATSGSALKLVSEGKLEMLERQLNGTARMEIQYFATVPLEGVPHTIQGFRDLVRNFESHVKEVNGGLGAPVEVELAELSTLDEDFEYLRNSMFDIELKFFEEYLDDLLSTKSRLKAWIETLPETLSKEQEKKIAMFGERLSSITGVFVDTVANLDLEGGIEQLDKATEAYMEDKEYLMAGKFRREFTRMVQNFEIPKFKDENFAHSVYVQYGSNECSGDNATTIVYSGYVASSPRNASGAGHNYLCLPSSPQSEEASKEEMSIISGVKYGLLRDRPSNMHVENLVLRTVVCSICKIEDRPSLITIADQKECPKGWFEQYSGFFMSSLDVSRAENLCVDSKFQSYHSGSMGPEDQKLSFVQMNLNQKNSDFDMGSSVLMYVIPMMLGSTYHLGKDQLGVQIFPETAIKNAIRIENHYTDSQYRMVENAEEIRNFLDIDGRLSLKIKAGLVNVGGEGKYLKDSSSKTNALEILIKLHFETMTETLPTWLSPSPGWNSIHSKVLGTHYCRSITYGGDLVASVRISASSKQDQQKIRGAFEGGVHTKGGGFALDLKGKLEMLQASGQDDSSIEIEYYASVPLNGVPHTVDGLIKLVDDFPSHVKGVNEGKGNPIKMELYPLNSLLSDYPPYLQDRALTDELDDLETHFDDLREARRQFKMWMATLPPDAPESINSKLLAFSNKLNAVYTIYWRTIAELDTSKGASIETIKSAFESYKDGEYIFPHKYSRKLKALQKEIYKEAPELQPRIGGAHYIHWGRTHCPANIETVLSGVMIGSAVGENGSSSDYLCSQKFLEERDSSEQSQEISQDRSLVSPLRYHSNLQTFPSMSEKNIACSHCRSSRRSSAMTFAARTICPEDWTREYEGYIVAPSLDSPKGQYICIDKEIEEAANDVSIASGLIPIQLTEVSVRCGSLPCSSFENSKLLPCVVCSI